MGNGIIAFHGRSGSGISVVQPDGSGLADVTVPPRRNYDTFPAWSPDGSRLAFLRRAGGGPRRLMVADADGSDQVTLAGDWDVDPPAWSPDGGRIALPGYRGEDASLLVVDVTDGTITPLGIEEAS
ncbi:MAG: TolB family protein [Actinomycetota bacterium]